MGLHQARDEMGSGGSTKRLHNVMDPVLFVSISLILSDDCLTFS